MKVLVTGASGFLGSHVAEQLTKEGHDVRALVRKSSNRDFLERLDGIEFAYGGVEDAEKVAEAVKGVDAIVHSAGLVKARSADEFRRTNVEGTRNLVEAAKAHAPKLRRFVFVSSLTAAGPSLDGTPLEGDGAGPVDPLRPVEARGRAGRPRGEGRDPGDDPPPRDHLRAARSRDPRLLQVGEERRPADDRQGGLDDEHGLRLRLRRGLRQGDLRRRAERVGLLRRRRRAVPVPDDGGGNREALGKKAFLRFPLPMPVIWLAAVSSELYGKVSNKAVMLNRDKINEIRQPHWVCSSARTRKDLDVGAAGDASRGDGDHGALVPGQRVAVTGRRTDY